jgi:hypothetical protein
MKAFYRASGYTYLRIRCLGWRFYYLGAHCQKAPECIALWGGKFIAYEPFQEKGRAKYGNHFSVVTGYLH